MNDNKECVVCGLTEKEAKKIGESIDYADGEFICNECYYEKQNR